MVNLLHSVITFKVAHQWCFEANSFNPASKYILIKTSKTFFKMQKFLDESSDSKETILKVVNILHEKFQVGIYTDLVVGGGKSYDHLIKLKSEYGSNLDWVLPYTGDWHILKNVLPVFIQIYFDAGLKELASKHHRGATLKVLTECSKFAITHRFFVRAWEAILRHQIASFLMKRSGSQQTAPCATHEILAEFHLLKQKKPCHCSHIFVSIHQ
jgi:hypothetical protein